MNAAQCPNCGAPITDLAAPNCAYCHGALFAASGPNVTLQGLAAATASDAAAVERALPQLAAQLQAALPGKVEVETETRGLLKRTTVVRGVQASCSDQRFILESGPRGRVSARICHEVMGILLTRREVSVAEWLDALQAALAAQADSQAGGTAALTRLLG